MNAQLKTLAMNDGASIPQMGLGVFNVPEGTLPPLMREAVKVGFRLFDTATHYGNEGEVGEALRSIELDRDEIFVSTKVPDGMHGYDATLRAFDASEKAIGRVDLYLIHWPQPLKGLYRETWKALVRLQEEKRVRSIGVANFLNPLIDEIFSDTGVLPAVNQIELHPRNQQREARAYHAEKKILTECWTPLEKGRIVNNPVIVEIAQRIGRTPVQVTLRWHLQSGFVVIPGAQNADQLAANFAAWDFALDPSDMERINLLDEGKSAYGTDPMTRMSDRGRIDP